MARVRWSICLPYNLSLCIMVCNCTIHIAYCLDQCCMHCWVMTVWLQHTLSHYGFLTNVMVVILRFLLCGSSFRLITTYGANWENFSLGNDFVKKSAIFNRPARCWALNCPFLIRSRSQKKRTSMLLDSLALMVSAASPSATVLSIIMVVGCWGYAIKVHEGYFWTQLLFVRFGTPLPIQLPQLMRPHTK